MEGWNLGLRLSDEADGGWGAFLMIDDGPAPPPAAAAAADDDGGPVISPLARTPPPIMEDGAGDSHAYRSRLGLRADRGMVDTDLYVPTGSTMPPGRRRCLFFKLLAPRFAAATQLTPTLERAKTTPPPAADYEVAYWYNAVHLRRCFLCCRPLVALKRWPR